MLLQFGNRTESEPQEAVYEFWASLAPIALEASDLSEREGLGKAPSSLDIWLLDDEQLELFGRLKPLIAAACLANTMSCLTDEVGFGADC